jgi:phosphate:Na+ symporter
MAPRVLLVLALLLLSYAFWASPDFGEIAAGIALFLFGMVSLQTGFKTFSGGTLEAALRLSTNRLWKSIGFGFLTTTLAQSSTLISLITISFVSAEMITLAGGIGVIMGANLGTTTGAWLIAGLGLRVDIGAYAMPLLAFGVVAFLSPGRIPKGIGHLLLGIGFLFLGIHHMKQGFGALQAGIDLATLAVPGMAGVLLFTAIGMLITVIMQSSHATLLLVIAALATGQVTYDNALALSIGANLGSAITTALGGLAANIGGKRLAVAHVLFNVTTAAVAIALFGQMSWGVDRLSSLVRIAPHDYLLKLALFHTVFNLLGVLLFVPFVARLEHLLVRHVHFTVPPQNQPRYLYPEALKTFETGVAALHKEVGHLYDNAHGLIARGLSLDPSVINSDVPLGEWVRATHRILPLDVDEAYEKEIKGLHGKILAFIGEMRGRAVPTPWMDQLLTLQGASRDIVEAVKAMKHLHKNLSRYAASRHPVVREQYDAIRIQIAKLLREIGELRMQEPEAVASLSLDALKLALETFSRKLTDRITELISRQQISPQMATSLMNDESYARTIGEKLLDAVRVLLLSGDRSDRKVEEQLALDKTELGRIARGAGDPATQADAKEIHQ